MKKKFIIYIGAVLFLIICGVLGFILWNNRTVSSITMDINPSIKINLNKKGIVKNVKALNEDAKDIVTKDLKNLSLDDTIEKITTNLIEKEIIDDKFVEMILYTEGNISKEKVIEKITNSFEEKQVQTSVIVIENVSKEDEKLAREYNISAAKAAYINSIVEEHENIDVETLIEKPVEELNETKETGKYCDVGYTLEGDFCVKEIGREAAEYGRVCPEGYREYKNKCYAETPSIELEEYECGDKERVLKGDKCYSKESIEATPNFTCEKGDLVRREWAKYRNVRDNGDPKQYLCEDKSEAQAPKLRCLYNQGHIMINGKCYNGPAPTINGGCPNGDTLRNGKCYSKDNEDQWQCPNGDIYEKSKSTFEPLCPDTFKYTVASGYYSCEEGYTLEGRKCARDKIEDAWHKRTCQSGYTMTESGCLNLNKSTNYIDGYYCTREFARLRNNACIIVEEKDVKRE